MHFFVFDRFIDCSNIRIYQFVTKVYKSHINIKFNKYGYNSSKKLQIQPENDFAIEIHVKIHVMSPETKYHHHTV